MVFCEPLGCGRNHQVFPGAKHDSREGVLAVVVLNLPAGQINRCAGGVEQLNPLIVGVRPSLRWIVHHLADHHVPRRLGAAERWEERGKQGEQEADEASRGARERDMVTLLPHMVTLPEGGRLPRAIIRQGATACQDEVSP